jgi:hypothetical protein
VSRLATGGRECEEEYIIYRVDVPPPINSTTLCIYILYNNMQRVVDMD